MKFLSFILLLTAPFSLAGLDGLGYNSYSLLKPVNGFYQNPAAVNSLSKIGIGLMFNSQGGDFYDMNLAYGQRIGKMAAGLGVNYKTSGVLDILNETGEKTGTFRYSFVRVSLMAASSSFFLNRIPDIHYGIRLKLENEKAEEYSDTGYTADIGLLYHFEFDKVQYIDRLGLFFSCENLGKNLADTDRARLLTGFLAYIPVVKDLSQVLVGLGVNRYLSSRLSDNSGFLFSLGFREALSLLSNSMKGYEITAGVSFNASRANRVLGSETGLEYGFSVESRRFSLGYDCTFNDATGNNYYGNLALKF
ncbi:MAG: hypothetical protein PHF84_06515 [bacterium]|nr:hypothetical protein [bacterium]